MLLHLARSVSVEGAQVPQPHRVVRRACHHGPSRDVRKRRWLVSFSLWRPWYPSCRREKRKKEKNTKSNSSSGGAGISNLPVAGSKKARSGDKQYALPTIACARTYKAEEIEQCATPPALKKARRTAVPHFRKSNHVFRRVGAPLSLSVPGAKNTLDLQNPKSTTHSSGRVGSPI